MNMEYAHDILYLYIFVLYVGCVPLPGNQEVFTNLHPPAVTGSGIYPAYTQPVRQKTDRELTVELWTVLSRGFSLDRLVPGALRFLEGGGEGLRPGTWRWHSSSLFLSDDL